ncbi:hypothetical protein BCR32DRAFT_240035 [Anaeromyces robustus]|uniref:RGS domain-containing protein n=1 Tax=Anaeromyces robustus TaxID=1754192 RepID=A0A1Y1XP82_9FUNG|nr:hypothetical protein BCR32DRAFT_240035 [Anaeromyces robustus]|eukprot:ORX87558.1 hypothetical protein BCR32DRAFT_240035 [Anaeromyces robustus]
MIEKRNLFNTTKVSESEFNNYLTKGFINEDEYLVDRIIYIIIFIIFNIIFIPSLILFYKLRNSYFVHQRNFGLTFFGGIIAYINAVFGFIPQITLLPCPVTVYSTNVINILTFLMFSTLTDTLIGLKQNSLKQLYFIVQIFGGIFMFLSFIIAVLLFFVKDFNKYGVKFECISTSIMILIFSIINVILQNNATDNPNIKKDEHIRMFLNLFEITKGGKILFNIISIYILFVSITLPILQYYKSKSEISKNSEEVYSIQYFYKILNTPSLLNQLRDIAIKEFSVENILFYENYRVLQKMVFRYQSEYNKAKETGNENEEIQYNFEEYYQEQIQSITTSSMDSVSYDPTMPVPKELKSYFTSFYEMFIDYNGPAAVNIAGQTSKYISNALLNNPTIGIFDMAKNEVVEMMFSTIYPIFLRQNKKFLNITSVIC